MKYKVIIADNRYPHYNEETEVLKSIEASIVNVKSQDLRNLKKACADADAIIVNLTPINNNLIKTLTRCKVISRYGVGYDNVDVNAATSRGIWVANVPDYCGEDVSDQAVALFMSCIRKVALRDKQVRNGIWDINSAGRQWRIKGKTFVFFGYGQIARIMHRKIAGFQLGRVLVYDPYVDKSTIEKAHAEKVDWDTALKEGDFFSIHMPLNEETRGLFNEDAFRKMKKSAVIINTSRGPVIDEQALYKALSEGWINSAGLDVFTQEPVDKKNPLLTLDNITVAGHTGWYTEESLVELKTKAAQNVKDVLTGNKPRYTVNQINPS